MDRRRARAVLGVPPGAGEAEIHRAFRRRAHAAHPDRGGTAELFRTLQEARDVLLLGPPPSAGRRLTVRRSLWRRVRRRLIRAVPAFLLPRHLRRLRRGRNLE